MTDLLQVAENMEDQIRQSNIPGIYATGDICGPSRQMAKAVGEGCVAGLAAAKVAKKARKNNCIL